MKISLRTQYLSTPRYGRYLLATGHDKERAKKLYHANIRLAQAFHPLLSQFEVVLRNSLNTILATHFNDPDWIIHQKTGFMHHHSLKIRITIYVLAFKKQKPNWPERPFL